MTRKQTSDTADLVADLRARVAGEVRFDDYSRALYSTDASIYQMLPVGVIVPRSEDDVQATVDLCHRHGVPILPRGGGTSLSGQTVNHAVVLDFSKYLNQVLEVNPEERWARVQPGITIDELNHHLRPHGLKFAPDPATTSRACVGGAIGNNSCGSRSIVYGKTVDHVRGLSVVLSDGGRATTRPLHPQDLEAVLARDDLEGHIYREVRRLVQAHAAEVNRRYPKILRRVSGYNLDAYLDDGSPDRLRTGPFDLTKLLVGSEGTLAVTTQAVVNLVPVPQHTAVGVLHFHDIIAAMEATVALLGHDISAAELLDKMILDNARSNIAFRGQMGFLQGDPAAVLIVEVAGDQPDELEARLDAISRDVQRPGLSYACTKLLRPEDQAVVWAVRRAGQGMLLSVRGDARPIPFVEDTAVPPDRLPDYLRRFQQVVADHGTTAGYYGHASVGCLHIRPLINLKSDEGLEKMVSIANAISDLVLEFGGCLSGEHGDGIVRGVFTEKMFGPVLYQAFRDLKRAFDPQGILNPGKIVDCPPMTENLRYPRGYQTPSLPSQLDFSADGSFGHALELCTGVGQCRKTLTGTMCPSYMVTREEEHSTRGRANALRAALTGLLPPSELTSPRMYQVLGLCLECKACKRECPIGVDMAKFKYEFLHHYHKEHRRPLRSRLFADIALFSSLGAATTPFSNWAARLPLTRWALDRFLGIDRRRSLPPFARQTFPTWFYKRPRPEPGPELVEGRGPELVEGRHPELAEGRPTKGQVVLFHDTYMDYSYPGIGMATVSLLEAAGYDVVLAPQRCCGRPMLSKGMLIRATANARANVDLLYPYVQRGVKIVGTEPSCLLTLRDEYPDLIPGEKARAVAQASYLLEEFLADLAEKGELDIPWRETPRKVLFHGHCHQKALVGTGPALKALRLVPGHDVYEVDSGCCGMAGAFGYEKEHYEVSRAIGERRLLPAVRDREPGTEVVVAGVSCRQQIEHFTGVTPKHIVEVLAEALGE